MKLYHNIVKSFTEPLSAEEMEQLEAWKNSSEDNLKAMKEFLAINATAAKLNDLHPFDEDQAWQNIVQKTQLKPTKTISISTWRMVAAALTLCLVSYTVFKYSSINTNASPNLIYATTNTQDNFLLEDGTRVVLDQASQLTILADRTVNLEGRAEFEVTRYADKRNFVVAFDGGKVVVLGTKFTINKYADQLEVKVDEGHVRLEFEGRSIDLYADDYVKMVEKSLAVVKDNFVNTDSWKTGTLTFVDDPIEKVLADIANHYKVIIKIDEKLKRKSGSCPLTSTFTDASIEEVFQELNTLFKAEFVKRGKGYYLNYIECK